MVVFEHGMVIVRMHQRCFHCFFGFPVTIVVGITTRCRITTLLESWGDDLIRLVGEFQWNLGPTNKRLLSEPALFRVFEVPEICVYIFEIA